MVAETILLLLTQPGLTSLTYYRTLKKAKAPYSRGQILSLISALKKNGFVEGGKGGPKRLTRKGMGKALNTLRYLNKK